MKKRTIPVLAVVAALSATAFVACGEDHTHDYKWDSNADAHWQICECGDKTAEEAHFDVKNNETGADGADELCDACGRNLHVHNYTWHSDGAGHWEECVCGDKHDSVEHVDEKNNNDPSVTEADGKCDVCGHNIHAVTFDVLGHGTAPKAQYVGEGAHASDPGNLEDDDSWKFKGWYKDEDCTVAYDFAAEAVSGATTIYAKWEDDDTAGASKKYAHVLALATENQKPATLESSVYYKYTAAEAGRYTVALALGASANGTFTTDLVEGTYGLDCDADEITLDLDAGQTVYILYTYKGETVEDITVSPLVSHVTDEPLPADYFLAGEYVSENNNYSFELNRENKQVTYMEHNYTARYIGGKFDTLSFVRTTVLGDEKYSLKHNANGSYTLTIASSGGSSSVALAYVTPQPPVALSALFGYYEPANYTPGTTTPDTPDGPDPRPDAGHGSGSEGVSGLTGGITELYIYRSESTNSTSVRYKALNSGGGSAYSGLVDATYDTAKNRLSFGQYTITLNLNASSAIESITFGGNKYLRKSDAPAIPPAKLPLAANSEYNGAAVNIYDQYGLSQLLGDNGITVMDYDQSSGKYSIEVNTDDGYVKYTVTVEDSGSTLILKDKDGALVDTLHKFVWNIRSLPARDIIPEGGAPDSIAENDFQKGLCLYEAQETGWYSFTIPASAVGYKNLNPNNYTDFEYAVVIQSGALVHLNEGDLIAVYMATPAAVTVSVSCPDVPVGLDAADPKVLENGTATVEVLNAQTYYFSYDAPSAGSYLVNVTVDGWNNMLFYTVNGLYCGVDMSDYPYVHYSGFTSDNPYSTVVVTDDDLTLDIRIDCQEDWQTVTVSVSESYAADATDLTLTGTPQDNSLTATATAATGANYHIASTKGEDVTVTGSAAFTVKLQGGGILEAEESAGVYTATIPAGKNLYFKLVSDTQQTLTLSQTFAKGSEGYPNEVAVTGNTATITVAQSPNEETNVSGYYSLPAGSYTLSHNVSSEDWWILVTISLNGVEKYPSNGTYLLSVNEGDVLCIQHNNADAAVEVTLNKLVVEIFTDEQVGTYNGTGIADWGFEIVENDVTLSFNKYGMGTYSVDAGYGATQYDILIAEGSTPGTYMFTYNGGDNQATFTFDNGRLIVVDTDKGDDDITMERLTVYTGEVAECPSQLIIKGNTVTYYYNGELMAENATVTKNGDTYSFSYVVGDDEYAETYTVTYTVDGDTIELDDFGLTGTLTKQA